LDPFISTDNSASYKAAGHCSSYFCRLPLEQKASTLALDHTHCSRDKTLSAATYKQKEIEGDYIPSLPGLLTEK